MRCDTQKIERQRQINAMTDAMYLVLPAALLAGDDIFCVTSKQTEMFLHAVAEILNGYSEEKDGAILLREEANARGIQICIKDDFFNQPAPKRYERANAVWATIQLPDGKKRTICSRCGRGTAVKEPYCSRCGGYTRNSDQEVNIMPEWHSVRKDEPPENIMLYVSVSRSDSKYAGGVLRGVYRNHTWEFTKPLPKFFRVSHWAYIDEETERESV